MLPALALLVLIPLVAEGLSGSTPLPTLVRPFVALTYLGVYGCGGLLVREVVARRRLTFVSVLLLGAAYGVLEEGALLRSWFDPTWMNAATLSRSLRVAGVSLLMPVINVPYHAVVSMAAPIALVEALTGSRKPWLSRTGLGLAGAGFGLGALAMGLRFNADYRVAAWQYGLALGVAALFLLLGLRRWTPPAGRWLPAPAVVWLLGAGFVVAAAVAMVTLSQRGAAWPVALGATLLVYVGYAWLYTSLDWRRGGRRLAYAAAAGLVTGLLPFVAVQAARSPEKLGNLALAGLGVFALLVLYRWLAGDRTGWTG